MPRVLISTILIVTLLLAGRSVESQQTIAGPSNPKAQATYQKALKESQEGMDQEALDSFKKADKEDGGKCSACQAPIIKYGQQLQDWKAATEAAVEEVTEAPGQKELALGHYDLGSVLFQEALTKHNSDLFNRSQAEFSHAIEVYPNFPKAMFWEGQALAYLNEDDAAKAAFQNFLQVAAADESRSQES